MSTVRSLRNLVPLLLWLAPLATASAPDEADDQYQYVAGLYEKGLYELVVREGEAFLADHARHAKAPLARYRVASALFELERPAEAAPHFRKLAGARGFEYSAESWLRLGQCELDLERPKEAEEALSRALSSGKDYLRAPASFLLGEAAFRRADYAAAEARYGGSLALDPEGQYALHALRGQAWCDFKTGRNERAILRTREFLKEHGDHELALELRFLLGDALLAAGRPEEALQAWSTVRAGPFLDAALRGKGFARSALGHHAQAAEAFGELLARFPEGRFAREAALQQGAHLVRAGRAPEARRVLSSRAAGADAETLYWLARAQAESDEAEAALATAERALEAQPEAELAGRIRALRGDLAFQLGRLDEAARAYEQAGSDYALHAAAVAHLNAGRPREAAQAAAKLLREYPQSPYRVETLLALGESLFALERYDEALAAFAPLANANAEVAPASRARALSRVAWCKYLTGAPAEAAQLFAVVARQYPDAPEAGEALFMQGRALSEAGDEEGAARALERFIEQGGGGEQRADALLRLARLEGDTARLEVLLREHPESPLVDRALFELARRLEEAGARAQAIERYRQLVREHPASEHAPAARYALAWCLQQRGRSEEATRELEALIAARPDPELLRSALELCVWTTRDAGDIDRCVSAWRAFGQVCRDDARSFAAARVAARALQAEGRQDEAQQLYRDLLPRVQDPQRRSEIHVELAWVALDAGRPEAAEAELDAALELARGAAGATLAEASFFVAEAFFERGELERAAPLYATAADTVGSPVVAEAHYKRGFTALFADDHAAAAHSFGAVVAEHPDSELWGESLFLLGEAQHRAGRHAQAVSALERLRRELPKHEVIAKALFRLGLSLAELGRWKEAEAVLAELSREHPRFENRAEAELARGRALVRLEDARGARAAFERVLADDEGVLAARARLELGKLDLSASELEDALGHFLKVALLYAHADEVAEALYYAGRTLEAQGEPELARRQYDELVEKHPRSPFAKEARARLRGL